MTATRPNLVLAICSLGLFMVGIDNTIVNVALPSIGRAFTASVSALQWTIASYTLVLASLLLLAGSTADRVGRSRMFIVGLAVFSLGSVGCGLAPNVETLIGLRVVQAVGGSMLIPVALSIIRATFDDARRRARAIGVWAGVSGVSFAIGPVLGGALIQVSSWRAVFLVNAPVGLVAAALTWRYIPDTRADNPRRPDSIGQLLVLISLASITLAFIEARTSGWAAMGVLASLVLGAESVVALVDYERRRFEPLIELGAFSSPPFAAANIIAVLAFAGFSGYLFLSTLYLQNTLHLSPISAGLYLLPMALASLVAGPLSGFVVGARGPQVPLLVGSACLSGGAAMLSAATPGTSAAWLMSAYSVVGFGFGMLNPPITAAAVDGLPPAQTGVAAAIATTSRQVGATLGVAVVGTIAAHSAGSAALHASSSRLGWWLITACGLLAAFVAQRSCRPASVPAVSRTYTARQPRPAPRRDAAK